MDFYQNCGDHEGAPSQGQETLESNGSFYSSDVADNAVTEGGTDKFCYAIDFHERRVCVIAKNELERRSDQFLLLEDMSNEQYAEYGQEVGNADEDSDNYTGEFLGLF